jgi:hypothetical protein
MIADVTGFIACGCAVDGVPLPGGLVHATDRWRVEHCLGPPGLGTWACVTAGFLVTIRESSRPLTSCNGIG